MNISPKTPWPTGSCRHFLSLFVLCIALAACGSSSSEAVTGSEASDPDVQIVPARVLVEDLAAGDPWTARLVTGIDDLDPAVDAVDFDAENEILLEFVPSETSSCPLGAFESLGYDTASGVIFPIMEEVECSESGTADANPHLILVAVNVADLPVDDFSIATVRNVAGLPGGIDPVEVTLVADGGLDDLDEAEQRWADAGIDSYSLTYELTGAGVTGRMELAVAGGEVADFESDEPLLTDTFARTVDDIFAEIRTVANEGEILEVSFDADLGYPTVVRFDPMPEAIDEEYGYTVTSLAVAEESTDAAQVPACPDLPSSVPSPEGIVAYLGCDPTTGEELTVAAANLAGAIDLVLESFDAESGAIVDVVDGHATVDLPESFLQLELAKADGTRFDQSMLFTLLSDATVQSAEIRVDGDCLAYAIAVGGDVCGTISREAIAELETS